MILSKITFDSFRSLVIQSIQIKERCNGFVGLNESGKTNILKGIRALNKNYQLNPTDSSKITSRPARIGFEFDFTKEEVLKARNEIKEWFSKHSDIDPVSDLTCFANDKIGIVACVQLDDQFAASISIEVNADVHCKEGFVYNVAENITIASIEILQGEVDAGKRIVKKALGNSEEVFKDFSDENFKKIVFDKIKATALSLLPKVVYWEFTDQYLIPSDITYDDFLSREQRNEVPSPLFNVFRLTSKLNIRTLEELKVKSSIWQKDSAARKKDSYLLTQAINDYVKRIWKEYDQSIVISLEETKITFLITDPLSPEMNFYTMQERSQGFKTFVSFLLTIAAEAHVESLTNYILVLDEPETHMHPSGVRFMRDELINLTNNNNYVFFATHSIFMIDRKTLQRHFIVEKRNEATVIKPATRNTITQEAVLYEAMGTAIDEFSLSCKNILFEGELDKLLYENYAEARNKKDNLYSDYELLDGGGTKSITTFFKDKIIPTDSKWLLVIDNDKPAIELVSKLRDLFQSRFQDTFTVFSYSEKVNYELDDLLPIDLLQLAVNSACATFRSGALECPLTKSRTISSQINEFKNRNSIALDESRIFEETFKAKLHEVITAKLDSIMQGKRLKEEKLKAFSDAFTEYSEAIGKLFEKSKNEQPAT